MTKKTISSLPLPAKYKSYKKAYITLCKRAATIPIATKLRNPLASWKKEYFLNKNKAMPKESIKKMTR